jgi:hypothetical protein
LTEARTPGIISAMIEHWFLASMLAVVGLEAGVCCFMAYRVLRRSEQIEALTAATYLEARKGLSQSR